MKAANSSYSTEQLPRDELLPEVCRLGVRDMSLTHPLPDTNLHSSLSVSFCGGQVFFYLLCMCVYNMA